MTFVQTEFRVSQPTAWRFMELANHPPNHSTLNDLEISPIAHVELASPTMPPIVIEMVETKQIPPTVAAIREAKREVLEQQNTIPDIPPTWGLVDGKPFTQPLPDGKPVEMPEDLAQSADESSVAR